MTAFTAPAEVPDTPSNVEPAVVQQMVEHAPGEGAVRAAALQREVDRLGFGRPRCARADGRRRRLRAHLHPMARVELADALHCAVQPPSTELLAPCPANARAIPSLEPVITADLPMQHRREYPAIVVSRWGLICCTAICNFCSASRFRDRLAAGKVRHGPVNFSRSRPRPRPLHGGCARACRGAMRQARAAPDADPPAGAGSAADQPQAARRLRDHRPYRQKPARGRRRSRSIARSIS